MQYQFTERLPYIKSVEFFSPGIRNSLEPLHVERIRYFQEEGVTGHFTKQEFRYSWDNATWSNWNTLTQANLSSISFRDKPNFYLHVKYSRAGAGSADISRWYLIYDEIAPTPPSPPVDLSINAWWFRGEGPEYFLDRGNHFGPYTDLNVSNVDDGSTAGVYFGREDSSLGTNLYFKRVKGTEGITVEDGSNGIITLGLDASIVRIDSSLVTAFDHLVSLDASVDELRSAGPYLKEASIGDGLVWVDGQLDVSVGSVSGESIDGGVWITNITPTSGGNVGDKSYSSDGVVLDYCLTDTSALTVHVLALPGHTNYKPVITINGDPVTISAEGDKPLFSGTYNIQYDFADASITVLHEDGAHWSTIVDADEPAEILSAVFIGGYPGSQTELKAGDTFDVSIMTDVPITGVILEDYGAFVANTFVVSGTNVRITGTIANRGTTVQDLGFSIKVVKSTGSTSASYLSENYGSTDGTYLVKLNNLYPSVAWGTITYPGTQLAIKSPESATAVNTASNYDTISYSSPNGQLTITNPTTYESPKTVTYLSGTYNVSTQNLRVTATRAANNASSIANTVISIANSPATLTVTNPAPRLRSGGNDGTAAVNHTITIGSNQRLLSAPDLTKDTGGTWVETEFTWSPNATSFTRSLQVHDDDAKATYDWKAITATNLAGIVTTTWSGATTYTLGGFVVRTVNLDPFAWQGNINVAVSDYTKLSSSGLVSNDDLVWTVKTLTSRSTFNDTSRPQAEVWSASGTLLAQPTTINILDKPATDSASVPSSFTIQEGI